MIKRWSRELAISRLANSSGNYLITAMLAEKASDRRFGAKSVNLLEAKGRVMLPWCCLIFYIFPLSHRRFASHE